MTENGQNNVATAFDMLLETVETELAGVNNFGMQSFEHRQYDQAKEAADRARRLADFSVKLGALRQEWLDLVDSGNASQADPAPEPVPVESEPADQAPPQPEADEPEAPPQAAPTGEGGDERPIWEQKTTPEAEFYLPILEVLDTAGGSCKEDNVLDKTGEMMAEKFNPVDLNPLPNGDPNMPIWRITAQWARTSLMKDGLIKVDPRKRVWEITDKGRSALPQKEKV